MKNNSKILVLFSSGIDSTAVLYWARNNYETVNAMIFDYDQKHSLETIMAKTVVEKLKINYKLIKLSLKDISISALIDDEKDIPESLSNSKNEKGIPFTYVPFRNGIFLSLAAAYAESNGIFNIATGFNLIDTPDYPDTTEAFTKKMEEAINQGTSASITEETFKIFTPLIKKTKAEIIQFGLDNGADFSYSVSCYRGGEMPCGRCPSCDIRANAFKELGIRDPLIERLKNK